MQVFFSFVFFYDHASKPNVERLHVSGVEGASKLRVRREEALLQAPFGTSQVSSAGEQM